MTSIDWKTLAPKRSDWERLSADFVAAGLPAPAWINGVPNFGRELSAKEVGLAEAIATGTTKVTKKQAQVDEPRPVHLHKKDKKRK